MAMLVMPKRAALLGVGGMVVVATDEDANDVGGALEASVGSVAAPAWRTDDVPPQALVTNTRAPATTTRLKLRTPHTVSLLRREGQGRNRQRPRHPSPEVEANSDDRIRSLRPPKGDVRIERVKDAAYTLRLEGGRTRRRRRRGDRRL